MSYRVYFDVPVAGTELKWHAVFCGEFTGNATRIIRLLPGLEWWSPRSSRKCVDVFGAIRKGIVELEQNPEKYEELQVYHEIDATIRFFSNLLEKWTDVCDEVDRGILEVMELAVYSC